MAPRNKQQENKEQAVSRVIYPRDGLLGAEIGGQKFNVPDTIRDKAGWIESRYREQASREAAEAEKEARDAAVLRDRQEQVRAAAADQQRRDALTAELEVVRAELADVRQQVANPDERRLLEVNQNTTVCMGRVLDAADKVAGLVDRVEELEAKAQELAALAEADRQASLDLIKNQIDLVNGLQKTNGDLINQYASRYTEAAQEAINLSEQIGQNWETVSNAAKINETAIAQATAASRELITGQLEEFRVFLSLALMAIGVTDRDIEEQVSKLETNFQRGMFILDQGFLSQSVKIARQYQDAWSKADADTNKAAAKTPNAYQFGLNERRNERPGYTASK